ncbi:hypothetical protein B0T26DRAFT_677713 [Lasiosphaeria miniovina]|uniref:Uncharacterized protein n=1 Tax=Lasiosphaeria miniovina TaxID=1954250 RepID=A0AA40ACP3_9PEZI|nr:uncharacterized protein B0T26DRAFT_677713 [Lasiosphaeria miniovina]KAK0713365.1 hypothetical protein B0T26DRAFT_677713 [Lasiosphaeria miniovina]
MAQGVVTLNAYEPKEGTHYAAFSLPAPRTISHFHTAGSQRPTNILRCARTPPALSGIPGQRRRYVFSASSATTTSQHQPKSRAAQGPKAEAKVATKLPSPVKTGGVERKGGEGCESGWGRGAFMSLAGSVRVLAWAVCAAVVAAVVLVAAALVFAVWKWDGRLEELGQLFCCGPLGRNGTAGRKPYSY